MIKAEIFSQDGKIIGFSIKGHAGFAPKDQDVYCAGVSTLTQSVWLCLEEHLHRKFDGEEADGKLILKLKEPPDELTEAVFQTMLIGLREIENLVPKAIKIKIINSKI